MVGLLAAKEKGEPTVVKVLMLGPARSVHGGISGVVNNYYEAGLNKRIDLTYIGTMVEGSKIRKLLQAAFAYLQFLFQVKNCDIVHVNVASDMSYVRKAFFIRKAKKLNKKIVIHQHGGDFQGYYAGLPKSKQEKVKEIFSMGDVFLVLAPVWKEFFGQIVEKEKIVVFPNSVRVPEKFSKEYGQRKLLFLGRICKDKGVGELLDAFSAIREENIACELFLGGIWEDKDLKEQIESYPEGIKYLGWISGEQKEKYLKECDIFVLPSYFEGQPVSILEAMSYSCAVAASDVGGIPQMVVDGQTGVLFEPKDVNSLKEGLLRLLKDEDFCKRLGENAREKIQKEFSIERNIEELLAIYERI